MGVDTGADLIFVSIASYRDSQLVPTIDDCLRKATDPSRLRFGICWQHGAETLPETYWQDGRIRILDVPWTESHGACWARAEVMKLWAGEAWFLQVDSHCRFKPEWDRTLIESARSLASRKVVLSTYANAFTPGEHEILEGAPLQMGFSGFTPEGIPHMKPMGIPDWQTLRAPRRARFLSAGFLFAPGSFVEDVAYDPGLYFLGEETAMTVRAFTSGYDLFHPHEAIVWHDYGRIGGIKHWEDHTEERKPNADWGRHDLQSKARVNALLAGQNLGAFGLGAVRTLAEYEAFAGISFSLRKVQEYTMRSEEPPNPPMDTDWADGIYTWMVRIAVPAAALVPEATGDASLWYIGVHDELGNEIFRHDLQPAEIAALPLHEREMVLVCELQSGSIPASWTVWPVSRSKGWLPKVQGRFLPNEYTVVLDDDAVTASQGL